MKTLTAPITPKQILAAYRDAQAAAESAVTKALYCGQLLLEQKHALEHGLFLDWLKQHCPEIPKRTAQYWMDLASRCSHHALDHQSATVRLLEDHSLQSGSHHVPLSVALADPAAQPEAIRAAVQLLLDFTHGKTIRECLEGIVVGGDEPHRLTRAHNGRALGGAADRSDRATYIDLNLKKISTHLGHWSTFTHHQMAATERAFAQTFAKLPTPLLAALANQLKTELKTR